ncbi:MAG: hypothetical protein LCH39_15750 [Proteobacteria bacterium]|nr:hypothetical protein [Pseudomonadota bacterium]
MGKSRGAFEPLKLKLMPEWLGQSGLWRFDAADGGYWPVDAEEIGLSEALADRLEDWTDTFDSIFDEDDPPASRFESRQAHAAFVAEGEALAALIRRELGAEVEYVPPKGLGPENA